MVNYCLKCGNEIKEIDGRLNSKYCSYECRKLGEIRKCAFCGNDVYKGRLSLKSRYSYCSSDCRIKGIRSNKELCGNYGNYKRQYFKCAFCGKEVMKCNCNSRCKRKFCDSKCYFAYRREHHDCGHYKGGIDAKCCICGKIKHIGPAYLSMVNSRKGKKFYCSPQCYKNDPTANNIFRGDRNPSKLASVKEKLRMSNLIRGCHYRTTVGKNEKTILDKIENLLKLKIDRSCILSNGYCVDGLNKKLGIIFEVDEYHHFRDKAVYKKDYVRQARIQSDYGYIFIRLKDKGHGDFECRSLN